MAKKKAASRADRRIWVMAMTHPRVIYEMLFFVFSFLSVVLQKPLLSVFGLLDMCFWSGSRIAIDAIRFNIHKMGQVRTNPKPLTPPDDAPRAPHPVPVDGHRVVDAERRARARHVLQHVPVPVRVSISGNSPGRRQGCAPPRGLPDKHRRCFDGGGDICVEASLGYLLLAALCPHPHQHHQRYYH